jgi:uncharacterized protein (UPF0332 family)
VTESEKIQHLIAYRLEQARESLVAAEGMLALGVDRSAVNRTYYAMFYAVLALLASRKLETSKHTGVLSRFDLYYSKPAVLPRELSVWLHDAFTQRNKADYAEEFTLTRAAIDELLSHAREFVTVVSDFLAAHPPVDHTDVG